MFPCMCFVANQEQPVIWDGHFEKGTKGNARSPALLTYLYLVLEVAFTVTQT
jgi:hypothetical protein